MDIGQRGLERGPQLALVLRMAVGVQQHDGDRLGLAGGDGARRARRRPRAAAAGLSGVIRSRAPKRRSGGVIGAAGRRAQAVQLGAVLAPERDEVGEPVGRDERSPGAAALEQRVGRDRHPVREQLDIVRPRPG